MRWLIDECVDADLAALLRAFGHDVIYMAEFAPRTADTEVMNHADREDRLLLTEDKDFGDLVFRCGMPVPGIRALAHSSVTTLAQGTTAACGNRTVR